MSDNKLTHIGESGQCRMVDISPKTDTVRTALAQGKISLLAETLELIGQNKLAKGNVLETARLAGIMAAKQTPNLIPLCHPIRLTDVKLDFRIEPPGDIIIQAQVKCCDKTGAEMEALTAVSVAALTIYDMCKAVDKQMTISDIRLRLKSGGKSGDFHGD